jgi:hypothetical protein
MQWVDGWVGVGCSKAEALHHTHMTPHPPLKTIENTENFDATHSYGSRGEWVNYSGGLMS